MEAIERHVPSNVGTHTAMVVGAMAWRLLQTEKRTHSSV